MHKISPCIWLNKEAMEAANFYNSVFEDSEIVTVSHYLKDAPFPEGTVLVAQIRIANTELNLLNGGPVFKLNPSISFIVECETEKQLEKLWKELSANGNILMELGEYAFSKKYGWCADKYGINWQLMLSNKKMEIYPSMLFVNEQFSKGLAAINFYQSIFKTDSKDTFLSYYDVNDHAKGINYSSFKLDGTRFSIMDSDYEHQFNFNEAFSFIVYCKDQSDLDNIYFKLLEDGQAQPCGWLKDKFGVSWQVVYDKIDEMVMDSDQEKVQRVMDALMKMYRIDVKKLQDAYNNKL